MSKYTESDDGKTVDGKVVVFLHPPRHSDGYEPAGKNGSAADHGPLAAGKGASPSAAAVSAAGAPAAGKKDAAADKPGLSRLTDPQWLESSDEKSISYPHKARARMRVRAEGLDGRRVRFFVEHQAGSSWLPLTAAEGIVSGGFAIGELTALHPGAEDRQLDNLDPAQLRFRAWLA